MSIISKSLIRSLSIYSIGNLVNAAIPFLLLPFLTNFLSPQDYGIIAIFQVLMNFLNPIAGLSLNGAVTRKYYFLNDDNQKFANYVSNGLLIITLVSALLLISLILFRNQISGLTDFPADWLWVILVCSFTFNIIEVLLAIWRVKLKAGKYVLFRVIRTLVELGVSVVLIIFIDQSWESRIDGVLYSSILFALIALVIMIKSKHITLKFNFSKAFVQDALKYGVPLIPHAIGVVFISMSDRLFLTNMIGIEETGLYAVGFQIAQIISLIQNSFNQAWVPHFFEKLKAKSKPVNLGIVKFTYLYFLIMIVLVIILTIAAPLIYSIFIGDEFTSSIKYVLLISLGFAFNGMYKMVVNYFFYLNKTAVVALITFISAIINILLNYFLILEYGAIGCAWATAISFFIQFILVWIVSSFYFPMPWGYFLPAKKRIDK
jgi:O-antigen/teichoic acid export membrane protein